MKILMIGTTDIRGGAAKVGWDIKSAREKAGDNVDVFVADKKSSDPHVHSIPQSKIRKIIGFILGTESLIKTDWILDTQEFKNANIVHCHNLHGRYFNIETLEKMSKLKPVVWTLHDEWAITPHCAYTFEGKDTKDGFYVCPNKDIPPRILWHSENILEKQKSDVYKKSNFTLVTPCKWLEERVRKSILKNKQTEIIYNGIDTNIFKKTDKKEAREKLGLPVYKKIILFLADGGKINPWKGWQYTEEVIKNISHKSDLVFACVGNDNPEKPKDNIIYLPQIKNPEKMALYYSACDLLLYSSIADNFPLVILEAMSCGLPIASFDTGGIKEVVTHKENGFIAKYKDSNDLLTGVEYLISLNDTETEKISSNSIQKIKDGFTVEKMVEEYYNLYVRLINQNEK